MIRWRILRSVFASRSPFRQPQITSERRSLWHDRSGAVALVFALAIIPLCLASGAAIDMGRAYVVKSRLGYALDAAGLAVGSATTTDEDELEEIMLAFFEANYPALELGVTATPEMTIVDSQVELSAHAVVNTTLMNIVGINTMTVAAATVIVKETKGLEVVLVLDNTGSMGTTKMNSLKDASHTFLDVLFGDEAENDLLLVGVVPFAASVNVGTDFAYLNNSFDEADYDPFDWEGCVMARNGNKNSNDALPDTNAKKWGGFLWPDDGSNNWAGSGTSSWATPNRYCPAEILPMTSVKSEVEDKIDEMSSAGNTHINFGLVWGWRVISPKVPFTEGHGYANEDYNKAIVLMTDGQNVMSSSVYSAYGYLSDGNLGTTSSSSAVNELNDRTTLVCDRIKNKGILLYTITFQVSSSSTRDLMEDCATDSSNYFDSPSDSELEAAFRAIGKELSNLRIGQ